MYCRLIVLAFAALTIVAAAPGTDDVNKKVLEFVVVNDIGEIAKKYPGATFQPLTKTVDKSTDQRVRYTLGQRVRDDYLVAEDSKAYKFPVKRDFAMQLQYGDDGKGAIVSFIDIVCEQDGEGKAYVVDGGIGQRFIRVVVESYQTQNFAISAQLYGVK